MLSEKLDKIVQKMEYILEGDPRTLSDRECKNAWVFDSVYKCLQDLKNIELQLRQCEKISKDDE